jgi:hypothetical protein
MFFTIKGNRGGKVALFWTDEKNRILIVKLD